MIRCPDTESLFVCDGWDGLNEVVDPWPDVFGSHLVVVDQVILYRACRDTDSIFAGRAYQYPPLWLIKEKLKVEVRVGRG